MRKDHGLHVIVHQIKNASVWGIRMAKRRSLLSGRPFSSPLPLPPDEWNREVCGSPECCVSLCSIYLDAKDNNDLIIWTDASFFPDTRKSAAAFGWESDEGLHVTAFRLRGSAARGEVIAILAALRFVEHNFPDRDVTLFSDCESAISKITSLLPLSSPPSISSLSSPFPLSDDVLSTESRLCQLLKSLSSRGRRLRLHWVKAHSSIIQNEMIDAAAKKEALNFRREALFEEKPQFLGEFSLKGQIIESREEIGYEEWRSDLDKTVMKVARSYHARRVFAGVQQWRGLKSNWASNVKGTCIYCHDTHSLAFGIFLQKCGKCLKFRNEIAKLWHDVVWDDDLLEGRVSHRIVREMTEKRSGSREEAIKEARARVRKWEKSIEALCKALKGRDEVL